MTGLFDVYLIYWQRCVCAFNACIKVKKKLSNKIIDIRVNSGHHKEVIKLKSDTFIEKLERLWMALGVMTRRVTVFVLLFALVLGRSYFASANTAYFFPKACLGDWKNVSVLSQKSNPSYSEGLLEGEYAFLNPGDVGRFFCGNWEGAIPEDSEVKELKLIIDIAIDDHPRVEIMPALIENSQTTLIEEGLQQISSSSQSTTSSNALEKIMDRLKEPENSSAHAPVEEDKPEAEEEKPISLNVRSLFTRIVFAEEVAKDEKPDEVAPAPWVVPVEEIVKKTVEVPAESPTETSVDAEVDLDTNTNTNPATTSVIEQKRTLETVKKVKTEKKVESIEAGVVAGTSTVQEDVALGGGEAVEEVAEEVVDATAEEVIMGITDGVVAPEQLMTVAYSIDGDNWVEIATLDRSMVGRQELSLPLNSFTDLHKMQISIQTTKALSVIDTVYVKNFYLAASFISTKKVKEVMIDGNVELEPVDLEQVLSHFDYSHMANNDLGHVLSVASSETAEDALYLIDTKTNKAYKMVLDVKLSAGISIRSKESKFYWVSAGKGTLNSFDPRTNMLRKKGLAPINPSLGETDTVRMADDDFDVIWMGSDLYFYREDWGQVFGDDFGDVTAKLLELN